MGPGGPDGLQIRFGALSMASRVGSTPTRSRHFYLLPSEDLHTCCARRVGAVAVKRARWSRPHYGTVKVSVGDARERELLPDSSLRIGRRRCYNRISEGETTWLI